MNKLKDEADEVSIECCKSLILQALNSKTVQNQLDNLPPYKIPIAMDMNKENKNENESSLTWQQLKDEMDKDWDTKKKTLNETEFHDFLEYVISETVFNVTAEMLENFESPIDEISAPKNENTFV